MKEIAFQKRKGMAVPLTMEDVAAWSEFKENQVTRHKVSGVKKERSYLQLKMLHGCLRTVSENTDNPNWNTLARAKFSLKVALHFIKEDVVVVDRQGGVHFEYRSFGYADLQHMEACRVFDRSWPILAAVIGVTEEVLLQESQNQEAE